MKMCKTCKYFSPLIAEFDSDLCLHPKNRDLVVGSPLYSPMDLRHNADKLPIGSACREEGHWWEAK